MSRALKWWSSAVLDAMASRLAHGWDEWCREWGCRGAGVAAINAAEATSSAAPSAWHALPAGPAGAPAWMAADPSPTAAMLRTLFGSGPTGAREVPPVAAEVCARAWEDLLLNCARWLGASAPMGSADEAAPPADDSRPWSGAVRVQLACEAGKAQPLWLHLSAGAASKVAAACGASTKRSPRPLARIVPVAQAMASRRVHLGVRLADVQLTLGALESLRPGDVVALAHRLEDPLVVTTHEAPVCHAHLGSRSGRRAVELVRPGLANP
jgi:hypothetical protein